MMAIEDLGTYDDSDDSNDSEYEQIPNYVEGSSRMEEIPNYEEGSARFEELPNYIPRTRTTYYGYERPGDADYDSNSARGIGDRNNQLSPGYSVALTQSERLARFGVTGGSTGQEFLYNGKVYRDDDSTSQSLSDRRVDIYSPAGPGQSGYGQSDELTQALQDYEDSTMSDEQIRAQYGSFLPTYTQKPSEAEKPKDAPPPPTQSPIDTLKGKNPELQTMSDDDIVAKRIQPAFPDVPIDKISVYARDPNGVKLLQEEENRVLTPLERFKRANPDFVKGKTDDEVIEWTFDNQHPDMTLDRWKEKINPPKPTANVASTAASGIMETEETFFANVDRGPQTLAHLYKLAGIYGWEQSANDWLKKNVPGYAGADDYWRKFVANANDRAKEFDKQSAQYQAQIPKDPANQIAGTVGEVIGSIPEIAVSFALGSVGAAAALWGMSWEGATAYGRAVEEHQKNALQIGAEAASMRMFGQYIMNTGIGRVASGFANSVASVAEEEVQKWLRGEPNDITQDGKAFWVGLITGIFMGGHKPGKAAYRNPLSETGEIRDDMPPEALHGPPEPLPFVKGSDILGTETGEVPIPPEESPIKIGEQKPVDPKLRGKDWMEEFDKPRGPVTYEHEFVFHADPAVNEEVTKAVEHYQNGNINDAHDHMERGLALMPAEEKKELTKKFIDKVEELGSTEKKPTPEKKAETRDDPFNDYFFSGVPVDPEDLDGMMGMTGELLKHPTYRDWPSGQQERILKDHPELFGDLNDRGSRAYELLRGIKEKDPSIPEQLNDALNNPETYARKYGNLSQKRVNLATYWAANPSELIEALHEHLNLPRRREDESETDYHERVGRAVGYTGLENIENTPLPKVAERLAKELDGSTVNDVHRALIGTEADIVPEKGLLPERLGAEVPKEEGVEFYSGLPPIKGLEKEFTRERRKWRAMFSPEKYVDRINTTGDPQEAETAGAFVKAEKGRTIGMRGPAQAAIARKAISAAPTHMQDKIAKAMRGGIESVHRKNYFDKFSSQERIQQFIDWQEGRPLKDPIADWMYRNIYGPMYEAINKREEYYNIVHDIKNNYFWQLLTHPADDLKRLVRDISHTLGGQSFVKPRQMMLAQRLALGHEMVTNNPEELLQMRWEASDRLIEKIRALKELANEGLAYRSDDPNIPYEAKSWGIEGTAASVVDPKTGEPVHKIAYHISPNIVPVINNSFDIRSVYRSEAPVVRPYFKLLNLLKGFTGIKLSWSLFHPMHIAQIAGADIAAEAQQRIKLGVANRGDRINALTGWVPLKGAIDVAHGYFKMADEINYLKERVEWKDLTPQQQENVRMFMDMGLKAQEGDERRMMFSQFMIDQLPELLRKQMRDDPVLYNNSRIGYRALTAEWFTGWWFGELTPRIKMAAAVMRRDTLMMTRPDLFKPQKRAALLREYQKVNRDIEGRYGEMNYDTLLWPRMAKEIGTSHLLSMGWLIGFFRTTFDAVIDMTHNLAHMARITKNPGPGFSNRIAFALNYKTAELAMGGAITYLIGRQIPTLWDLVYPRVGKDKDGKDKRVNMQGFMKEFPSFSDYLSTSGSLPGALVKFGANRLNPGFSAILQAAFNKDYMGRPIGNLQQQLGYWASQTYKPMSVESAQRTIAEGGSIGDLIMDGLGFTPAPKRATRSATENMIIKRWSENRQGTDELHNAREAYRQAYNSGIQKDIQAARQKLVELKLTDRQIARIEKESHWTTGQKMFHQLSNDNQIKQLKQMSPEERKEYLPHAHKEVQKLFHDKMPTHPTGYYMPKTPQHALTLAPGTKFMDPAGNLRMVPQNA